MDGESHHKRELNKDPLQPTRDPLDSPVQKYCWAFARKLGHHHAKGHGGQTCHRRFQQWVREGKLKRILRVLAKEVHALGQLELAEAFIDASFTGARKGGTRKTVIIGESEDFRAFATLGRPDRKARRKLLWHGVPRLHADLIQMFIMRCSRFCQLGRPY